MLSKTDLKLLYACQERCPSSVKIENLIKMGANLNCRDEDGRTPLDLICYTPIYEKQIPLDIIKLMVKKGARPEQSNCLYQLSRKRDRQSFEDLEGKYFETLMFLIDNKANPAMKKGKFLMAIFHERSTTIIEKFIKEEKIDLNLTLEDNTTLLHMLCASKEPNLGLIKSFILEKNIDPSVQNDEGNSCLQLACAYNHDKTDLIRLLLEQNMDPNQEMNLYGTEKKSPLFMVCNQPKPCIETIRLLLSYGANVKELGTVCEKLMPFAIENNHLDLGVLLIMNSDPEQLKPFGKPDGSPLEQLIDRLASHDHPKDILNFMQKCFDQMTMPKYYKKLPQNEQATVLSFLECLHVKKKTGLPNVPKPVLNLILGQAVNSKSAMIAACEEIIDETLLKFPHSGGPEYK